MTPFKLFVTLYAVYNDLDPTVFDDKFNGDSVKTWNSAMNALCKRVKLEYKHLKELMYFAYVHNPLNSDKSVYGNTQTYYKVASHYKNWKIQYQSDIDKKGFMGVLFETKPGGITDIDRELLSDFD